MRDLALPDETIYSVLARATSVAPSPQHTESLRHYASSTAYSSGMFHGIPGELANALGFKRVRDASLAHTLLPYFCAFLPSEPRDQLLAHALGEAPLPRKAFRGDFVWMGADAHLRYCTDCAHYDRVHFGVTYWHRVHQLPGINRCIRHRRMLMVSHVRQSAGRRFTLVPAELALTLAPAHRRCSPLMNPEFAAPFERMSAEALTAGFSRTRYMSADDYRDVLYREFACEPSWHSEFSRKFKSFADARRLKLEKLGTPRFWLRMHIGRKSGFASPTEHMLMQAFLTTTVAPVQARFEDGF